MKKNEKREKSRRDRAVLSLFPASLFLTAVFWVILPWTSMARAGSGPGLEDMAGQMLLVGFRGLSVDDTSPIVRDVAAGRVGGVILFDYDVLLKSPGRNVDNPEQVRGLTAALQSRARVPLFMAVDQEGGRVQRLKGRNGFADTPSAADMGAWQDPDRVRAAGLALGRMLSGLGLNLDFAPVADVDVNPQSPAIGALGRSFSADPEEVARDAEAFAQGLNRAGVLSCLKHFPGHGSARSDSHLGLTDVTATWSEAELIPYERLIPRGLDMVMAAHVFNARLDPDHPASLSQKTITGLLRGRLGFQGVVVSDDLQMGAVAGRYSLEETVRLAVLAGNDILVFGNNLAYDPDVAAQARGVIVNMVRDGVVPEDRVCASYERIMALKNKLQMQR